MSENRTDVWLAESLRCTVFPTPSAGTDASGWWTRLTGGEPESRTSKPRTGEHREEGVFDAGWLVLSLNPIRIDWLYAPRVDPGEPVLPVLGGFEESLSTFLGLVSGWLDLPSRPPMQRVALGVVLLQPVESRQTGYRRIADYLPAVQIDPEGSSDFLYQINRPTKSAVIPGQVLNRLSKWSVALFAPVRIQVQLPPPQAQLLPGMLLADPGISACRLEMDLSTPQGYTGELPPDQVPRVYNEMAELARDIARNGDRP